MLTPRTLGLALLAMLLAGATAPFAGAASGEPSVSPSAPRGATVRWGGLVVAGDAVPGARILEVQGHPLDGAGRPDVRRAPLGRFLVRVPAGATHRAGELIAVTGRLGSRSRVDGRGRRIELPMVISARREVWPPPPLPPPVLRRRDPPPPAPSLLPLVVPLAIVGAVLAADHSSVSFGVGHSRHYGYYGGYGHLGYRHGYRRHHHHGRHHYGGGVSVSLGFRL